MAILLLLTGDLLVFDSISCAPAFCEFSPVFLIFSKKHLCSINNRYIFKILLLAVKFIMEFYIFKNNDFKKCCDRNGTKVVGTKLQILKCLIAAFTKILMFLFKFIRFWCKNAKTPKYKTRPLIGEKLYPEQKRFKIIQIPRV